jgi:hypothetical protein
MRLAALIAALAVAASIGLASGIASAQQPFEGQSILGGRLYVYQGAWCGHQDTGGGNVEEDCSFDSFQHCRFAVIGVNNGFCTQNPAFTGHYASTHRKKKRHAYR